ncbi:MAG TPA: adenine glycosylase [Atopobiaceae bacterium]|nr:adenine glycosylase [Atopobiaceae bacterium]
MSSPIVQSDLDAFCIKVVEQGAALYRDLPWRNTRDPYAIWISEVMLQQTQVSRVDGCWQRWLERFPSVDALAAASTADVLEEWQGMGYNRRALAVLRAAQEVSCAGGRFPEDEAALRALPGIGPATAAGIRAFSFNKHAVYLETNVRTVFLHELFPEAEDVSDKELVPLVDASCPPDGGNSLTDPRSWYYALLDYGAHLKKTLPNPSRRSRSYTKQSRFEGSNRQKRAALVRILLAYRTGIPTEELAAELNRAELLAGRAALLPSDVEMLLTELQKEGFCTREAGLWRA